MNRAIRSLPFNDAPSLLSRSPGPGVPGPYSHAWSPGLTGLKVGSDASTGTAPKLVDNSSAMPVVRAFTAPDSGQAFFLSVDQSTG